MTPKTADGSRTELIVRKTIVVNAPQAHVFRVFTEGHGTWWPLQTHHIGSQVPVTAIIEPRAGGRWFERAADGNECDHGRVLAWEPPHRLVLAWQIDSDWHADPTISSEVEIRFIAEGLETTRVELEHRKLDCFGEKAAMMHSIFQSEAGWTGLLRTFGAAAERAG